MAKRLSVKSNLTGSWRCPKSFFLCWWHCRIESELVFTTCFIVELYASTVDLSTVLGTKTRTVYVRPQDLFVEGASEYLFLEKWKKKWNTRKYCKFLALFPEEHHQQTAKKKYAISLCVNPRIITEVPLPLWVQFHIITRENEFWGRGNGSLLPLLWTPVCATCW